MTKTSTKSKRSTASDTVIKSNRWLRLRIPETDLPQIDDLLNLYWSGPERRITKLTVRIMAVNAIALLMLFLGIGYLGQYHSNLIEEKLQRFSTETALVAIALAENTIEDNEANQEKFKNILVRLNQTFPYRTRVFDARGSLLMDNKDLPHHGIRPLFQVEEETLESIRALKNLAGFLIKLFPQKRTLPLLPDTDHHPDVKDALKGLHSLSAWSDQQDNIWLYSAAPLFKDGKISGAVLLSQNAKDIRKDVGDVWLNIIGIFLITLILTILLSIYLSGIIANPLKRLAKAAEGVRKGKLAYNAIPDLSDRKDEIGELSLALRQMMEALSARMDTIDRFASDVAHELKNPLTSLRSAVETAAIVKKKTDREKLMKIVQHDLERLDRLISDISAASRLDSELSRDIFSSVDIRSTLHDLVHIYKDPLARENKTQPKDKESLRVENITINLNTQAQDDVLVWGHKSRLEQVFQNLLSNALSFSPPGGTIDIKISTNQKHVEITFTDEGPGIPDGKTEKIFERFYTQRPDHEDYGQHSGLGLSICKQIITAMDGRIFADNVKDKQDHVKGARFTVILKKA